MTTVSINGQDYTLDQEPTTQEDNAGGIVERWKLLVDGEYVGKLVQWDDDEYGAVVNSERVVCTSVVFHK